MLKHRLHFLVAASLLGGAIATPPRSGQAQDATPVSSPATGVRTTAIVVSATNDPLRVSGSDGVDHLEYDLLVTNGFTAPVTLTAITVTTLEGATLLQLEGDDLVTATQPLLGRTPTAAIPASGTVAVVMDVTVPPDRAVDRLDHRITYEVAPDAPVRSLIGSFAIDGPQLPVDPRPTTIIAPPLRGDGWLANNGCCAAASVHRAVRVPVGGARIGKQETFAIDWARLRDGQPFAGDGARPEDKPRQEVLERGGEWSWPECDGVGCGIWPDGWGFPPCPLPPVGHRCSPPCSTGRWRGLPVWSSTAGSSPDSAPWRRSLARTQP
jgi:hypothetical protein